MMPSCTILAIAYLYDMVTWGKKCENGCWHLHAVPWLVERTDIQTIDVPKGCQAEVYYICSDTVDIVTIKHDVLLQFGRWIHES